MLKETSISDFFIIIYQFALFSYHGHGFSLILYLSKNGNSIWYIAHMQALITSIMTKWNPQDTAKANYHSLIWFSSMNVIILGHILCPS